MRMNRLSCSRLARKSVLRHCQLILFCALNVLPLLAAEPASRDLKDGWEFRAVGNTDRADIRDWHPAQVPGVVQTDLLHAGLIPDPYYQDNEFRLQWIGLTDWEYRTTLPLDGATLTHEHVDLVFEGLDTYAEVYVNDQCVLQANDMFRRWRIPAKNLLKPGANSLRVVFHSPVQQVFPYVEKLPYVLPAISSMNGGNEHGLPTAPYTRKAPYQYGWDWGPRFVTEGIWRPVRLETWDELRVENFHIHQQKISVESASITAELEIEASHPATVTITHAHDSLSGPEANDGVQSIHLDQGSNRVSFPTRISSPKLWYPLGYGAQDRYRFSASLRIGRERAVRTDVITGLRSIELRRDPDQWGKSFAFVINGIPVFAKGANVIPFDSFPPREKRAQHRMILESARDAHMNMLREWGGGFYEFDDFYDICDELGILVWQEFSFGGDMVPGDVAFQENVSAEAIDQIKRLRDHPSIVIWCGNNEVETGWYHWADRQAFKEAISPEARDQVWKDYIILFADILKSVVNEYAKPGALLAEFP
jgi:beta-mannosidase